MSCMRHLCVVAILATVAGLVAYVQSQGHGNRPNARVSAKELSVRGVPQAGPVEPDLVVAFMADTDVREGHDGYKELELVKAHNAQLLLHQGDLDYYVYGDLSTQTSYWEDAVSAVLGPSFPVLVSPGNHDLDHWFDARGHGVWAKTRLHDSGLAANCSGVVGYNVLCSFRGLLVASSGVGTTLFDDGDALESSLSRVAANFTWRACVWHTPARKYQTGLVPYTPDDDPGYKVYDACREYGAFVITGHDHAYARSKLMSSFNPLEIATVEESGDADAIVGSDASTPAPSKSSGDSPSTRGDTHVSSKNFTLTNGRSFAIVNGLGGASVRPPQYGQERNPWWAATQHAYNGGVPAVLFCTFNPGGLDERRADCALHAVADDRVLDSWTMYSDLGRGGEVGVDGSGVSESASDGSESDSGEAGTDSTARVVVESVDGEVRVGEKAEL